MGILRTALRFASLSLTGGATVTGAGMAWLAASTAIVDIPKDDPWLKTKTYTRYNPKANPALQDACIKRVPLSKIRPELRGDDQALTLEFCRGVWGRWAFLPQSKFHAKYDAPPGTEGYTWEVSQLAAANYEEGLKFSNHFEVVENSGEGITVRCGGSPLQAGLRDSDGLVNISARVDHEAQEAVLSLKSALFNSAGTFGPDAVHGVPPKIQFLHRWYVRMLTQAGYGKVKA